MPSPRTEPSALPPYFLTPQLGPLLGRGSAFIIWDTKGHFNFMGLNFSGIPAPAGSPPPPALSSELTKLAAGLWMPLLPRASFLHTLPGFHHCFYAGGLRSVPLAQASLLDSRPRANFPPGTPISTFHRILEPHVSIQLNMPSSLKPPPFVSLSY